MGAMSVYGLDSARRDSESNCLFEFGHVNAFFLKIGILANHSRGVKLSRASSVGVSSALF